MFDTIAAISTGNINQPISIIRISGPDAFAIAKTIYSGEQGKHQTITFGNIIDGDDIVDEVLVSWFIGPNSFTGEDTVEINAHGGIVNTQKILRIILSNGARIAEPGEFSRRAYLNKKMDLIKAEAIHDLIFAKTEEQSKLSVKKFDGQTSNLIGDIIKKLLNIIATIETNIDYPEYDDIEILTNKNIKPKLTNILKELLEIKESSKSSRYIYDGIKVGIVGMPNAGKSTLLNSFLGEDKAIVSSSPGTTRDVVEGQLQVGQVLLNFSDTAGIHNPTNKIEELGIEKSFDIIKKSDLILHVIDVEVGEMEEDKIIEKKSLNKIYIKVFNKNDLVATNGVSISAKNNDLKKVLDEIKSNFKNIDLNNNKIITNTRQLSLIDKSITNIENAINAITEGLEPDEVIIDIRNSWKNISSIIGESSDDKMLDEMFKNFCLGK